GDRHQPRDRARPVAVERGGLAPYRDINLLQHVLCLASIFQDTKADAKKLRGGILINEAQCRAVPAGDARESGGKLAARGVCVHLVRCPGRRPNRKTARPIEYRCDGVGPALSTAPTRQMLHIAARSSSGGIGRRWRQKSVSPADSSSPR